MRSRGTALVLVASWLISACVTTAPPEDLSREESLARWQEFRESLSRIDHWKLRGKMGVRTGSKGGSATLNWEYSADAQEIQLYGPLGGGRVIITTDAQSAFLRDTRGREMTGKTASEVLCRRGGWQVPVDHWVDWARGWAGEGSVSSGSSTLDFPPSLEDDLDAEFVTQVLTFVRIDCHGARQGSNPELRRKGQAGNRFAGIAVLLEFDLPVILNQPLEPAIAIDDDIRGAFPG